MRRSPTTGEIVQATLVVDCPHRPWPVHITQPSSGVACPHLPWPAQNGHPTSTWLARIAFGLHTTVSQRRTRAATIVCDLHTSVNRRHTLNASIICSLHTSVCQHRTWPGLIVCGLRSSAKVCTHQQWHVRIDWPTSTVACAHRPGDVGQRQATSAKACRHLTWYVHVMKVTSAKAGNFSQGMHASIIMCAHQLGETPFMHNNSFIYFFIIYSQCFRLTWFIRTNPHYFYGSYDIETTFICTNMYSIISFTCLKVFSSILRFFEFNSFLKFILMVFFTSHFKNEFFLWNCWI